MKITYDTDVNLLYIRFDAKKQNVTNQTINDNSILDIGKKGNLFGIEILDASEMINLEELFPVVKESISISKDSINEVA